ncbi:MAG: methyltransferase domain-containing protein [Pseudomonadota bacterium]
MTLYGADLARIQAAAFGDLAERAAPELIALLKASSIPVRRVYDVGCGAGVTTRALVEAGFDTIAVEPSPHLLAIARTAAPAATFLEVSAYDLELRPCEAVLAIGEVLTYHAPDVDADERVRTFFRTVARALAPGGRLVFDLIDADGPPLDAKSWRSEEAWAILWETREDRAAARLTRSIETFCREADGRYRRTTETHPVKLFREADVRAWLTDAGFDVHTARAYGAVPLAPRRVAYVATRTASAPSSTS